jgi:hypothetical protein
VLLIKPKSSSLTDKEACDLGFALILVHMDEVDFNCANEELLASVLNYQTEMKKQKHISLYSFLQ